MTRINPGVDPRELPRLALFAEFREITRVPNALRSGRYSLKGMPSCFCLNKGHMKFFYDKVLYLRRRYLALFDECRARGINCADKLGAFDLPGIPESCMGDWEPDDYSRAIVIDRIRERGHVLNEVSDRRKDL